MKGSYIKWYKEASGQKHKARVSRTRNRKDLRGGTPLVEGVRTALVAQA